jgi:hypothetical protein
MGEENKEWRAAVLKRFGAEVVDFEEESFRRWYEHLPIE